jgi:glycerate kinase
VIVKAVLAFDSFKESLPAAEVCGAVADALRASYPGANVISKPMADGGEGTASAVMAARGGDWIPATVTGPLSGMRTAAGFLWFPEERGALVEMAAASGLTLLRPDLRDPLRTTTFGTGELLRLARDRGARRIWLAIGGSATVDGGVGAAAAAGWRFLDEDGEPVGPGGGELGKIRRVLRPVGSGWPAVEVLCDVDNPLCGEHGAARVYGPQKGATPAMVELLDAGLANLAGVLKKERIADVIHLPGAGAAGGLGGGAVAFFGGRLVSGIETILKISGMAEAVAGADWVFTGEGRFDPQSLRGKVVSGVVRLARAAGAKVAVIAGSVEVDPETCRRMGIAEVLALRREGMSVEAAIANAPSLLAERVAEFAARNRR